MLNFYDHGQKTGAKQETYTFDVVNKEVSHLLIDFTATGSSGVNFNLTVEAYLKNGRDKVLIENYPADVLREFMDYESGAYSVSATNIKLNIPIGTFHLQDMEKLVINITDTSAGVVTGVSVNLVSVLLDEVPDRNYLYRKTKATVNSLADCNAVLLDASNCNDTDEVDYRLNGRGGVASILALKTLKNFMMYDQEAPNDFIPMLFSAKFEPTQIHYEMKHSNDFTLYYRQIEADQNRVISSKRQIIRHASSVVQDIAEKRPEQYKGFVQSQIMPPVSVIKRAAENSVS